jgi:hypothetical protein
MTTSFLSAANEDVTTTRRSERSRCFMVAEENGGRRETLS